MTPDPVLILAAICILLSLAGLHLFARLRAVESMIYDLRFDRLADNRRAGIEVKTLADAVVERITAERTFALDLARTTDDLADLRGEHLAQARALDAHDERLQALERDATDLSVAFFKTASTVDDHGGRLDYVERHVPDPS